MNVLVFDLGWLGPSRTGQPRNRRLDDFHPVGMRSPIRLRDVIEEKFDSPAVQEQVREMQTGGD